jgi:hypothetical protein
MPTGWGGDDLSEPDFKDRVYLYVTCDCIDFARGAMRGMNEHEFSMRKPRIATVTVADCDDPDALEYLYETHRMMIGEMFPLDDLEGKLVFRRTEGAYRRYFVTKTYKPYKRKKGGKITYHLVIVTDDAIEPTDFCCKHVMTVAQQVHPGFEVVWMTDGLEPAVFLSNQVVMGNTWF